MADHRCQRGRFTRARGADDDHQTARHHRDVLQSRRQMQGFQFRNRGVDMPHHHAGTPLLHEHIDPETADLGLGDGEVGLVSGGEFGLLLFAHQHFGEHRAIGRGQRLLGNRADLAVELERRRETGGKEQVGCIAHNHEAQPLVDAGQMIHIQPANMSLLTAMARASEDSMTLRRTISTRA